MSQSARVCAPTRNECHCTNTRPTQLQRTFLVVVNGDEGKTALGACFLVVRAPTRPIDMVLHVRDSDAECTADRER